MYEESLDSKFIGVGIYIKPKNNGLLVEKFLPGSPAKTAGLKVNDIITHVDGDVYISEETYVEFANKIRGKIDTNVELTILRNQQVQKITVQRAQIKVPTVELEIKNGVPIIHISKFDNRVADEFVELLEANQALFNKGIVINLRNNTGGYLTSGAKLSSVFAKEGELMFVVNHNNKTIKYVADIDGPLAHLKNIIVLQNKATASASEVLASFLSLSGRAKLYGTTSYGKGNIQQIKYYPNGASIKVTTGDWRPLNGISINKKGLEPDVRFGGRTSDQIKNNIDPALEAAVQAVKNNQ